MQDDLQDLARECIILAEILQDFVRIALSLKVSFKFIMFLTRVWQEWHLVFNVLFIA